MTQNAAKAVCRLSVIVPNFNQAPLLERALRALQKQDYDDFEIIVVDDGSTDGSHALIEKIASQDERIRYIRHPENKGSIWAGRTAREAARGEYLYGAPSDDYVLPGFFAKAMRMAERHPEAGIIFGKMLAVDTGGAVIQEYGVRQWKQPGYISPAQFLKEYLEVESPMHSMSGATVFKRSAFESLGGLREDLGPWRDTFLLRAIGLKYGACYIPERCSAWTVRPDSFSQTALNSSEQMMQIAANVAGTMRKEEFRDIFPESHVRRWERGYAELNALYRRPSMRFLMRGVFYGMRLPILNQVIRYLIEQARKIWVWRVYRRDEDQNIVTERAK